MWVTKKKKEGASRRWPAETSAHKAWSRVFSHSSPSSHILSHFHFPSVKFPPSSSTICHVSCHVSWHTCLPPLTEGWGKMRVGGKEWGRSWPGGMSGCPADSHSLSVEVRLFLLGRHAMWGDDDTDGWMRSVNKQQLVGCWLSYCAAVSWMRNVLFRGSFLGRQLPISTAHTQLGHMQNARHLNNKCTLDKW